MQQLLAPINQFLGCETPQRWIDFAKAPEQLTALLIDHCNCELKAAQTAMMMIRKYAIDKNSAQVLLAWAKPYEDLVYNQDRDVKAFLGRDIKKNDITSELVASNVMPNSEDLMAKMVRLIKEEFHHFEQVLQIMTSRGISYSNMRAGRYAKSLISHVRTHEPLTMIDKLIVGAFIEARSCERFAKLAPHLDDELAKFYVSLLRSEARHFQDYLVLAQEIAGKDIDERVAFFREQEAALILSDDTEFRFHSGIPAS
ncbi:tRNA isopentenyl-2-thiomethyl-A-37 hydroxylase MiaE [Shewanella inventionis]|uniref:tRNA-(Ms[2]io[6]A)-hydroxylase n=1 Tax=Shewanella inventionis TaxID=1738770 RepID=A0ABQ1JAN4_9GAMM|nr:tRNA isopentenyl-2-thiomethyl-A-37 hydroxylase MiaE [Shewanella inventionis]MCL1158135.1 tRNA isopentenyl-2-thiomethyl-A-37 hydroxylase MiaE [Shewanella inventionis]UAL42367.1 tRNA isopentenyl-2-thiomethyl-A-37 hydroxylase MiaE [Shewanella inventionis]GGB63972.1 tRNA-(ms[2]io[6]A)-hydroxylase [Shewanella inventionis]